MDAREAVRFAFDWPVVRWLPCRCCTCGAFVGRGKLFQHMDREHSGWLDEWNAALHAKYEEP
jgi:hypothetical protein